MKFLGKTLIFVGLLGGIAIQASEVERKHTGAQEELDAALYPAIEAGDADRVKELLARGANPNNEKPPVKTVWEAGRGAGIPKPALMYAINNCKIDYPMADLPTNPKVVEALLEAKASPNYWCEFLEIFTTRLGGRSTMNQTSYKDNLECVRLLLAHKSDVNKACHNGNPQIVMAVQHNLHDLLILYLRHNFKHEVDLCKKNRFGKTFHDYVEGKPNILWVCDQYRARISRQELADGLPRFSLDLVGVVAEYII